MKQYLLIVTFLIYSNNNIYSQKVIQMEKHNGVFMIPCKVNGIPMKFIFDTGASDVMISKTEAKFLIKQGLLTNEDFLEKVKYQIASGEIQEGTKINIKKIEINELVIENVTATIIHELNAPLLLGQSVLSRLGKITIEENQLIIHNTNSIVSKNIEKEINETINWLNQKIQKYQYDGKRMKTEYELSTEKHKGEFFIRINQDFYFWSDKRLANKMSTLIPIKDIWYIEFRKRGSEFASEDQKGYILEITMKNKNHSIIEENTSYSKNFGISESTESKSSYIINLERTIDDENLQERIDKSFHYLKSLTQKKIEEKF